MSDEEKDIEVEGEDTTAGDPTPEAGVGEPAGESTGAWGEDNDNTPKPTTPEEGGDDEDGDDEEETP